MSFIFGILIGATVFSGGSSGSMPFSLSEIPFRCFAALDVDDAAYKHCRRLSMALQISQQYQNSPDHLSGVHRGNLAATIDEALVLEVKALRTLEQASKARVKSAP